MHFDVQQMENCSLEQVIYEEVQSEFHHFVKHELTHIQDDATCEPTLWLAVKFVCR